VPYLDDIDDLLFVVNRTDDAVITLPDAVALKGRQLPP